MKKVLIALSATLLAHVLSVPAQSADHIERYVHNGSVIEFVWDTEVREWFEGTYIKPRKGLSVRRGTRLISAGYPASGEVSATVYVFKKGCSPAHYVVNGRFRGDDLYLSGRAPIREAGGCRVVGYAHTNNSSLVFKRIK